MKTQPSGCMSGRTIAFGVGTIFLVIGYCLLTFWGKPTLENAKNSVNWPTVPGKVTESKIGSHTSDGSTTYSADVTYRYLVEEAEIHSDRVWFGDNYSSSDRTMFERIVNKYPVGKEVKVYYNPDDEFIAVLEPGAVTSSYIGFGMGWGFMGIGFGLLLIPMGRMLFKKRDSAGQDGFTMADEF